MSPLLIYLGTQDGVALDKLATLLEIDSNVRLDDLRVTIERKATDLGMDAFALHAKLYPDT